MPAGIDTPWWKDASRGGRKNADVDVSAFLTAQDVAEGMMSIITQNSSSDIEEILLEAPQRRGTSKL